MFAGFAVAALIAIPLGLAMGTSRAVERNVDPLVESFRPIAAIAILPLAILWLGTGTPAAVFIVAYAAFFPIVVNTIAGAKRVNPTLLQAAATMGLTRVDDDPHGRRARRAAVDRRRPAHRAWASLDRDRRGRARRRREGRRRRLGRHRPDDVRVLRVQHRAQPHHRLHDRRRPRRARARPAAARAAALRDAVERRDERRTRSFASTGVGKRFAPPDGKDTIAVEDFSLDVRQGEFLVIVGPSGCGKTTVLNLLAGLELADVGHASRSTTARSPGPAPSAA